MRKTFEYMYQTTALDSIEVESVGDVCLHVLNDFGYEWYLMIETSLGTSYTQIFGPIRCNDDEFSDAGFNYSYYESQYNEGKLSRTIDNFINDPKKFVTQVFIIEKEEVINRLRGIIDAAYKKRSN